MALIKDPGPTVGDAELAALEARIGKRLPRPYRDFLLSSNGGVPVPNTVDVPGYDQSPTDLQEFFGLGLASETSRIEWNIEMFSERLDPRLVPIACDSGGNLFCLSIRPADEGAVLYCDLEAVYADYGKTPPTYLVAPDFSQFVTGLRQF